MRSWSRLRPPLRAGRALALLMAAALALLLSACGTLDPVTGAYVYNLYSLQDDVQMGRQYFAQNNQALVQKGTPVNPDPAMLRKIEGMVQRIAAVSDYPSLPYRVTLYGIKEANAAAFPGGPIMVFQGLYNPKTGLVRDDDELAAVLAHEIAHVNCRHSTATLSRVVTAAALGEVARQVAMETKNEDWAPYLDAAFTVGSALLLPRYSRAQEAQADRIGMRYMAKAGYDPRAAVRIWKRVSERTGESVAPGLEGFLNDHPTSTYRYRDLEQQLPEAMALYEAARAGPPAGP